MLNKYGSDHRGVLKNRGGAQLIWRRRDFLQKLLIDSVDEMASDGQWRGSLMSGVGGACLPAMHVTKGGAI